MDASTIGMKKREIISSIDKSIVELKNAVMTLSLLGYEADAMDLQSRVDDLQTARTTIAADLAQDPA